MPEGVLLDAAADLVDGGGACGWLKLSGGIPSTLSIMNTPSSDTSNIPCLLTSSLSFSLTGLATGLGRLGALLIGGGLGALLLTTVPGQS